MMITLMKDRIIHENGYRVGCDLYVKQEVSGFLSLYLEDTVRLAPGFTLEDLFSILEKEKSVFNKIFASALGQFPLELYLADMKKPAEDGGDELSYLELCRCGERTEGSGEIEIFLDFFGRCVGEDIGYAIEFSPLFTLKDLPIHLNSKFSIDEIRFPSRLKKFFIRLGKLFFKSSCWMSQFDYRYVEGITNFSVYELLSGILSEITFVGTPENRDKMLDDTLGMFEEYREGLED